LKYVSREEPAPTLRPWARLHNCYKRNVASSVFKRPFCIQTDVPLISFTFDDFPRTALVGGGTILSSCHLAGTYYTSLGLMGKSGPSGPLYQLDDLNTLLEQGHELGCHTFGHCHSWDTDSREYESSVLRNKVELQKLFPGQKFKSLSYPISEPRPLTKRRVAPYFQCCRAGGQALNAGKVDLNQLAAFFLEKSRDRIHEVTDLVDQNRKAKGWIIFATHDVAPDPSPYGCTPEFFESVVRCAVDSGARILPVAKALESMRGNKPAL
jgi:Polysaccharide deacetylase